VHPIEQCASAAGDRTMTIFERAAEFLHDGDIIGLGSGRASIAFIELLGQRVANGLNVRGVPTSRASEETAQRVGIPLVSLDALPLVLTVDGADEVDPALDLIKGYGRALVREKVVAAASLRRIILVGQEKLVSRLGQRGNLPIEVVPFAVPLVRARLRDLGLDPSSKVPPSMSDNGNVILDCKVSPIADPLALETQIRSIPGVVGTGLFLGMADVVLVGDSANQFALIEERTRSTK